MWRAEPSGCVVEVRRRGALGRDSRGARTGRRSDMTSANVPDMVEALVELAPIGMAIFDREMRFVRNPTRSSPRSTACRRGPPWATRPRHPADLAAVLGPILTRVLEAGEQIRAIPVSGVTPSQPGVMRHWEGTYLPLDVNGERLVAVYVEERTLQARGGARAARAGGGVQRGGAGAAVRHVGHRPGRATPLRQ